MAKKKPVYHCQPLTAEKQELIASLINEYNIKTAEDIQNALKDLLGSTVKSMMEAEMTEHLGYKKSERSDSNNYRNGTKSKKIRSTYGEVEIAVPKDRNGTFRPKIVPNRQKNITEIDSKIIGLYARGMTTREISDQIQELYGFECSEGFISDVTDKIYNDIIAWQTRPLDKIYPVMFIDAVHFSVRDNGIVQKLAAYVIIGIKTNGRKDVLGLHIGENESAKYWLQVLNDLKNRGVRDVMVICADGLSGIKEAIASAFPKAEYQRCIVHMVRNTLTFVPYKHKRALTTDLRSIYLAPTEEAALNALDTVTEKWKEQYPYAMKRWHDNWNVISPIFKFSMATRKIIYTTNVVESLNSTYKRLNSKRTVFPDKRSLLKALYLATDIAMQKWTMPMCNWYQLMNEFHIIYGDRLPE